MGEPLDLYCERVGPGLFGEPFNAISNLAFFLAAAWVWHRSSGERRDGAVVLLAALIALIGIGSTLFHAFADTVTHRLDTMPILVFQLAYLWLYVRRALGLGPGGAALCVLAFLTVGLYAQRYPGPLNGSLTYAPALLVLLVLGILHSQRVVAHQGALLVAGGILFVSLFIRTIDLRVCDFVPMGTHFLWHLLNAVVLALCAGALPSTFLERRSFDRLAK